MLVGSPTTLPEEERPSLETADPTIKLQPPKRTDRNQTRKKITPELDQHHSRNLLLAGGLKPPLGWNEGGDPVRDKVHINEINATALHWLGIDQERFSLRHQGLAERLIGVKPMKVIKKILR